MADSYASAPRDAFILRFLAAVAFGVALLAAAYGAYFMFWHAPAVRTLLNDMGASAPRLTRLALTWPWIPLGEALTAMLICALAWHNPQRWILVCAYLLTFMAVTVAITAKIAMELPFVRLLTPV